jgi:dynein heavy chain
MGIEIPEGAKIVLFQEEKFKKFYSELHSILTEYDCIVADVIPVTAMILVSSVLILNNASFHPSSYILILTLKT